MAGKNKLTVQKQSGSFLIASKTHTALSLKPISLIIFSLFAQHSHADDALNLQLPQQLTESAIQKHIIVAENAIAADEIDASASEHLNLPSNAARYNVTKEMLLAAKVTDENPNGSSAGAKDNVRAASKDQGKNDLPLNLELKEITVRAKRFYQIGPLPGLGLSKEEIPGNVQSITAKEIKESHALSLTDLMNSKLQSVNVNDYQSNPFQMDVTYRGFTASPQIGTAQGLSVFLDGIRVNEPFGDVVNWDMIPLNALSGLDVFPGSNPIFGLGTLGGALSMRTKSGFDANEGTIEALGGSFNRKQFQGSIGGNNGVIAGFAAANIFNEDGWRDNSPSKVNQIFAKGEWRNEKLQFGLSALYAGNKLVGNGMLPTELVQQDPSKVFTSPDETQNKLLQFQLTGLWDVTDTFNITGQIYKRKSKRNASTGDLNNNFSGTATRRPNPGELISPYYSDLDNDGLPDIDPSSVYISNVATSQDGFALDINGNPEAITDPITGDIIPNPAFDSGNLAIGTDANTAYVFATPPAVAQATQTFTDSNGNTITRPSWSMNSYNQPSTPPAFSNSYYQKALQVWQIRSDQYGVVDLLKQYSLDDGAGLEFLFAGDPTTGFSYVYLDTNGFQVQGAATLTPVLDANGNYILASFNNVRPGLGRPLGVIVRDPVTGIPINRDGADDVTFGSKQGYECDANGQNCTPTALITETQIDQVTDGAAIQFNWNLENHKFMVGASLDSSNADYKSGQYLGLLDQNRRAYLDANKVGYEFAAASNKIGLNDFSGNSITKSLYFSETWSPVKEFNITGAARYNVTRVKNELALNNILGISGPSQFLNFYQPAVLCTDNNSDGAIDPTSECPSGEILPFTIERAGGLGAIGKGETEKFSYYSFNPSLGATWQPNEALNLYANWSKGARTPSVIELGCAFDDTPAIIGFDSVTGEPKFGPRSLVQRRFCSLPSTLSGDPYLKQVRSVTSELGARGYITPDLQWNIAAYNTDLTDDIYFVSFTPERSFFTNIGKTRRRGLEMGLQGKVGKSTFRLNYSLTDATFQENFNVASPNNSSAGNVIENFSISAAKTGYEQIHVKPGDRMPGVPLHNLNASWNYELTPDWSIGLTAVLHSESFIRGNENNKHRAGASSTTYGNCPAATSQEGGIQYGNASCTYILNKPNHRFPGKVPGYAVFNFNTAYKLTKGLTAGLQVTNLFNREYYSAGRLGITPFAPSVNGLVGTGGFNYNSSEHLSSTFLAPGAPRAAFFSLTYDFDMGK